MSRYYFSHEEDEAHRKGERDASYGRHRDYEYDCHFGGDVDTTAAIAMSAASCSSEIKQDLPANLINGLENGQYGRDYLIELDRRLRNKFFGETK